MSEGEYRHWWLLHRRAALGQPLSESERQSYEDGLRRLHVDEPPYAASREALAQTEARIAELEDEHDRLIAQRDALLSRVTELEARRAAKKPGVPTRG